jgi:hypothetical protein
MSFAMAPAAETLHRVSATTSDRRIDGSALRADTGCATKPSSVSESPSRPSTSAAPKDAGMTKLYEVEEVTKKQDDE